MNDGNGNNSVQWSNEKLSQLYSQLNDYLTQFNELISNISESNKNLASVWNTNHAKLYFEKMNTFLSDSRSLMSKYDELKNAIYKHIQVLNSLDE